MGKLGQKNLRVETWEGNSDTVAVIQEQSGGVGSEVATKGRILFLVDAFRQTEDKYRTTWLWPGLRER